MDDDSLTPPHERDGAMHLVARIRNTPSAVLLVDYDGTLTPFADTPDLAVPDAQILLLLEGLSTRMPLHIVSGRPRETLEQWFGHLTLGLHAEHGLWSRVARTDPWTVAEVPDLAWIEGIHYVLTTWAARFPGALVERKSASVAWHYRMVVPETATEAAAQLAEALAPHLRDQPAELLWGNHVLEVRPRGIDKGRVLHRIARTPDTVFVAIGDDVTDEDLFAALPANGIAVHVGSRVTKAGFRLRGVDEVRAFLAALLA